MQINCPNCGNVCEIEGELAIGQHLSCPFCSEKFVYPGTEQGRESLPQNVHAEESSNGEITAKCPHCGTLYEVEQGYLGQEATCETCGRNFVVTDVKTPASDSGTDMTAQESVEEGTNGKENATILAKAKRWRPRQRTVTWWKSGKERREAFCSKAKMAVETAKNKVITPWNCGTKGKIIFGVVTLLALCIILPLKSDNAAAQYELGKRYKYGRGVTANYTKYLELCRKAAESGCAEAQNWLGSCYCYGFDAPKDLRMAIRP